MALDFRNKLALRTQSFISYVNIFWFGPMFFLIAKFIWRYRVLNSRELRQKVSACIEEAGDSPLVVCANHMTMVDSFILPCFIYSPSKLVFQSRLMPWNVPELTNFGKNIFIRMICYLGKCVYVERQGSVESRKLTTEKLRYLLRKRHVVCLFPEGGRSRTGKLDLEGAVYGVGQLLLDVKDCKVLNIYMRGVSQETFSFMPKVGEEFYLDASLMTPTSEFTGRRASKDLTMKIMYELKSMEDKYFGSRERHC